MIKSFAILLWLALVASLFSCNSKKNLEVKYIGTLESRKSYANVQFMDVSEDSIDAYVEKQQKSDPWLYNIADSVLRALFKNAGFIKDDRFVLSKFQAVADSTANAIFITANGNKIVLKFYSEKNSGIVHFQITDSNKSVDINTETHNLQQLDYAFLDIIPGGNKELVYLNDYYIMNGDNFHFMVYEIITN